MLATLGIRELFAWGPLAKPETLQQAIDAAEKAHRLRPEDGTVLALVAQAYTLQWARADDDKVRKSAKDKIEAAIAQAEKRGATPVHLHTIRLQWLVSQAAKASEDAFGSFKTLLNMEIDKAIADARDDPSWYGHQLMKDAIALRWPSRRPRRHFLGANLHWPN